MSTKRQATFSDIRVKVVSGAKKDILEEISPGKFVVNVKQKAMQGRANTRVCELIAEYYQVQIDSVLLIKGASLPSKIIRVYERG